MIPKIIHYCWFGRGAYSPKIEACIASWKKYLPDYEFKLWNEDSFDIENSCQFVKDAYANRKWAFVSDYVRIYALREYGGIYLDTDIEIVKPFEDSILNSNSAILGTDEGGYLTALMISPKGHSYFNKVVDYYENLSFYNEDGSLNMEVNNTYLQSALYEYGYTISNSKQVLSNDIIIYPDDYFHVRSLTSGKLHLTPNSYAIHWHTVSWGSPKTKFIRFVRMKILVPMLGSKLYSKITQKIKKDASYI